MNFDDVELLLEGVLEGLKARKEIEPLRQRLAELEEDNQRLALLAKERDDFKRQFDKAEQRILDMQEDFNSREKDLRGELQAATATANYYRDNYGELDAAYKIYSALDEATRSDLAGIFGTGETATGFFSGAVQETHLAPFWDYVSRRPDNDKLRQLFDFCFDVVNLGFREAPYVRLQVDAGNYFDNDIMRRTSHSLQMGRVIRVALQGYRYSSGNVVRKTIVELG